MVGWDQIKTAASGAYQNVSLFEQGEFAGEVASGFMAARGLRRAASAEHKAALYNASVLKAVGAIQSSRARRAARLELGRERVTLGKSGLQAAGTPLERIASNAAELERQAVDYEIAARQQGAVGIAAAEGRQEEASRAARAQLFGAGFRAFAGPARRRSLAYALSGYGT